jgi:CRP-like cAMP-binding protein
MKSLANLKKKASPVIKGAWVALGIPFDVPMIDEKVEGIIDVEALIMATLLLADQDRMATDLPAWLGRFSSLINHQKLRTMFDRTPSRHRLTILENLNQSPISGAHKSFRSIFNLEPPSDAVMKTIQMRAKKLNSVENVAQTSLMIRNRLQYGTGFRADIIALTNIKVFGMKGTQLAGVLCTNDSTVSRILSDLRACRFIDQENERIGPTDSYSGMFISSQSLWNLCEMIDAVEFKSEELKRGTFENLNLRHDGFGTKVLKGLV